jgi:Ser/Thr protein kinase RdoA (MazF antagonist)
MTERLADLVTASMARVGSHLEAAILGTTDAEKVAAAIASTCEPLGAIVDGLFYEAGVGLVVGLRLDGGTEVVVKVHRFHASLERLTACVEVQRHLHDAGLPAPRPLLAPRPLGDALATVEELRAGTSADGRSPEVRRSLAEELHRFIEAARPLVGHVALELDWSQRSPDDDLWPEPHDLRFDFAATAAGAEWIDDLARLAMARRHTDGGPVVIGHLDWRVQNVAFDGPRIVAIYDWDSVALASEAAIVGIAAAGHPVDWRQEVTDPPPNPDQMRAFVADYEGARGEAFTVAEREILDAANLSMVAYSARCQHSDQLLRPDLGDNAAIGWPRLLRQRGERCLTLDA